MKKIIRKKYINIRKNIQDKYLKSHQIFESIIKDNDYINAKVIGLYKSTPYEVSTEELINYSLNLGKIVALPKVEGNIIKFYKIQKEEPLVESKYHIFEPIGNINNYLDISKIDLIIVPGVCFDIEKNRLGYGKGYYDRYLSKFVKTIGICFDEQITSSIIPIDEYDIKIDKIISDKKIIH